MRIGVLGDVHAEHRRLEVALRAFDRAGVEQVLCVGDVIDGLGNDEATVSMLRKSGAVTVRGNHERWLADAMPTLGSSNRLTDASCEWLANLPTTVTLATPEGSALLCHAVDEDDMTLLLPRHDDAMLESALTSVREAGHTLMIAGHTHVRMVRRVGSLTVVNAGTLYRKDRPGCLVLDLGRGEARFVDLTERSTGTEESHSL